MVVVTWVVLTRCFICSFGCSCSFSDMTCCCGYCCACGSDGSVMPRSCGCGCIFYCSDMTYCCGCCSVCGRCGCGCG